MGRGGLTVEFKGWNGLGGLGLCLCSAREAGLGRRLLEGRFRHESAEFHLHAGCATQRTILGTFPCRAVAQSLT